MKLSEKHIEQIAATAVKIALEYLEKEKQLQEKSKRDRRLRNVKLLLKHYRSFSTHCADIKLEINELDSKLELDELDTDEFAVESIKRSKERTLAMVKFINKMLKVYKIMSEQSSNPEDLRRYQTVYNLYISDNKKTVDEISEMHKINRRTVYKDVDKACETLSILIFGVDGIKFNS